MNAALARATAEFGVSADTVPAHYGWRGQRWGIPVTKGATPGWLKLSEQTRALDIAGLWSGPPAIPRRRDAPATAGRREHAGCAMVPRACRPALVGRHHPGVRARRLGTLGAGAGRLGHRHAARLLPARTVRRPGDPAAVRR